MISGIHHPPFWAGDLVKPAPAPQPHKEIYLFDRNIIRYVPQG